MAAHFSIRDLYPGFGIPNTYSRSIPEGDEQRLYSEQPKTSPIPVISDTDKTGIVVGIVIITVVILLMSV